MDGRRPPGQSRQLLGQLGITLPASLSQPADQVLRHRNGTGSPDRQRYHDALPGVLEQYPLDHDR